MSLPNVLVTGSRSNVMSEVVASLPMSYALSDDDAQVIVVDGHPGWPTRARLAIRGHVRGIIVTDPVAAPAAEIESFAESAASSEVVVLLSESWAGNPAILAAGSEWQVGITSASSIESSVVEPSGGASSAELVLRQLRLLRRLGVSGVVLRGASETANAYSRVGDTRDGAKVILFGVRSSGSESSLAVVATGPAQTVSLRVAAPYIARPASAARTTPTGGEILPTIYETGHRATFILMHELLISGETVDELRGFAEDAAAAEDSTMDH